MDTSLGSIPTDHIELVNSPRKQPINNFLSLEPTTTTAQYRPAQKLQTLNLAQIQQLPILGIQSLEPKMHAPYLRTPIMNIQVNIQLPDHDIQPRAQTSASYNCSLYIGRLEIEVFSRAG